MPIRVGLVCPYYDDRLNPMGCRTGKALGTYGYVAESLRKKQYERLAVGVRQVVARKQ